MSLRVTNENDIKPLMKVQLTIKRIENLSIAKYFTRQSSTKFGSQFNNQFQSVKEKTGKIKKER